MLVALILNATTVNKTAQQQGSSNLYDNMRMENIHEKKETRKKVPMLVRVLVGGNRRSRAFRGVQVGSCCQPTGQNTAGAPRFFETSIQSLATKTQ